MYFLFLSLIDKVHRVIFVSFLDFILYDFLPEEIRYVEANEAVIVHLRNTV